MQHSYVLLFTLPVFSELSLLLLHRIRSEGIRSNNWKLGHIRCMQARPKRRRDQLQLRSLCDLRSRWVFAPVRPRLAKVYNERPQGASGSLGKWGHIRGTFFTLHHS